MNNVDLKSLEMISGAVGNRPEYIQGGGGNTSVKIDGHWMAVKASGFRLKDISSSDGIVYVNYANLIGFFDGVKIDSDIDYEKESNDFIKRNSKQIDGHRQLRPSVETAFHSLLKKFVIHSHPVYANILCCMENGQNACEGIFRDKPVDYIWIPYIQPGFLLSCRIRDEKEKYFRENGKNPSVIFMENHGLIVTDDDARECLALHENVNSLIRDSLGMPAHYPELSLERIDENTWVSKTNFVSGFLFNRPIGETFFEENPLYPDQLVYINQNVSFKNDKKLNIDLRERRILYKTNFAEASAIEENLLAYFYVIDAIWAKGFTLRTMGKKESDFIRNWEAEKYRSRMMSK
jgi:ribulose-5-phosphate 4-epimerase/fuculose-1-phosphate aldolase